VILILELSFSNCGMRFFFSRSSDAWSQVRYCRVTAPAEAGAVAAGAVVATAAFVGCGLDVDGVELAPLVVGAAVGAAACDEHAATSSASEPPSAPRRNTLREKCLREFSPDRSKRLTLLPTPCLSQLTHRQLGLAAQWPKQRWRNYDSLLIHRISIYRRSTGRLSALFVPSTQKPRNSAMRPAHCVYCCSGMQRV